MGVIIDFVNSRLDIRGDVSKVSMGMRAKALILNGLGFTNNRLYLVGKFFENKPLDRLLEKGIQAEDLNDDCFGRFLDKLYEYGATKFYSEIAFEIASKNNLLGGSAKLDTTNFTLYGDYDCYDETQPDNLMEEMNDGTIAECAHDKKPPCITYGHAKNKRHDLKQITLSLAVTGDSSFPFWMEALDGNSSDKKSFHETISRVNSFKEQLKNASIPSIWVADSALYTIAKLKEAQNIKWITRVPETIKEAKNILEIPDEDLEWVNSEQDGYKYAAFCSVYGELNQRWLLVFSAKAHDREKKTLDKNIEKELAKATKDLWHLGVKIFHCENDAKNEMAKYEKTYKYHNVTWEIESQMKYETKGRKKEGAEKVLVGYKIVASAYRNEEAIKKTLDRKGRFLLATNELDNVILSDENFLKEYKEQGKIERGFQFIKDPSFMIDSFFLKKPERIEALMVIMTLCLMVYNFGQKMVRDELKNTNETLPNQIKKQTDRPTLRWIFQLMEGITAVRFYMDKENGVHVDMLANGNEVTEKIIRLFGQKAVEIYGLEKKQNLCAE